LKNYLSKPVLQIVINVTDAGATAKKLAR